MERLTYGCNSFAPAETLAADWSDLIDLLRSFATISREPSDDVKRKHTPWIAPFVLRSDAPNRELLNVESIEAWLPLDIDEPGWSQERLEATLGGVRRISYTTTKSRPEHQRWRVIVALTRSMTVDEHASAWRAINMIMDDAVDLKTRNANRLSYVPARWVGADNLFIADDGGALDVDELIAIAPPVVEPEMVYDVGSCVIEGVQARGDLITRRMIADYATKPKGGRLYDMMCSAAARSRRNGWALEADELAEAALTVSRSFESRRSRPNIVREAARAIAWANWNVDEMTAMEKLRDRILWSARRAEYFKKEHLHDR